MRNACGCPTARASEGVMPLEYGRPLRDLWHLDPKAHFLNHGSWGACPKSVFDTQSRLRLERERAPDRAFEPTLVEIGHNPVALAIAPVADFIGAPRETVAPVENATVAIQAVLNDTILHPGDEILLSNHQYNSVKVAADFRCRQSGATMRFVDVPLGSDDGAIERAYSQAASSRTKLAILDHITSATAIILPIERLCKVLRKTDTRILVDGAHALGQIPFDITKIDCDFYTTNLHKWLYAPTGTALIYARERSLTPAIVSHRANDQFPIPFYYAGSRDYSAWLSGPAALAFFASLDPSAMRAHATQLLAHADRRLATFDIQPILSNGTLMMRSYVLPQSREAEMTDGHLLKHQLWDNARLAVFSIVWEGKLLLRLSAAPYADDEDIDVLCRELSARGWPGR